MRAASRTVLFLVVDAVQVAELLEPAALRAALEDAMEGLSAGRADVPPRIGAATGSGILGAMPGYLEGVGLAAKLVSVFPENIDVPSHQGLIALFDDATGTPLAIMDAQVITERRTAMTAAIAADLLANDDADVLTIVGGGAQAVAHAQAFTPLRPWREVRVHNRDPTGGGGCRLGGEGGRRSSRQGRRRRDRRHQRAPTWWRSAPMPTQR